MRFFVRSLLVLLVLVPLLGALLVWFALSPQPAVVSHADLSPADVERARDVLKSSDPRQLPSGATHSVRLGERDINLVFNYLARKFGQGAARASLGNNTLNVTGTIDLRFVPLRPYLNVESTIDSSSGLPRIARLRIGSVPVPAFIAQRTLEGIVERVLGLPDYKSVESVIRKLEIRPGQVAVQYLWQPEKLHAIGAQLAGVDTAVTAAYHAELLALQRKGIGLHGSLTGVLPPLFALAQQRSAQGNAVSENRALLLVLGAWAADRGMRMVVPQATAEPKNFALRLQNRRDLAQHFLVSAALAAGAEAGVSNVVGLYKEISDSRGGSGFSFADLTADRAGTRFGELATASNASARRLQQQMSGGVAEPDIMPLATDLPEGMSEAEFQRRYREVGSPEYRALMGVIERRVSACSLYRG